MTDFRAYADKFSGAKGKFEGDCEDWESDKDGEACFVQMINGEPDGQFGFVAEL